jgi:acetyl esterase/lipase
VPSPELLAFNSEAIARKPFLSSNFDPVAIRAALFAAPSGRIPAWKEERAGSALIEWRGTEKSSRVIMLVAGGGFCFPAGDGHRALLDRLCEHLNGSGALVHHRLAPEHAFPSAHEDIVAALVNLLEAPGIQRLDIVADSSGASLVLTALAALRGRVRNMPQRCTFLSPLTDLAMTGLSHVANSELDPLFGPQAIIHKSWHYLQGTNPTDRRASPFWGDAAGLPPMLLIAGSTETMLDDTLRYADKVNAAGGSARTSIYEAAPHVFPLIEGLPEARQAFDEICAFLSAP